MLVELNAPDLEAELSHAGQHFLTIDHESYIGTAAETIDRRSPYTALEQNERLTGRRAAGCEGIIANERDGIPALARALWGTARPLPERAYICSTQTSHITGQNFLIDGGAYPGAY